MKEPLDVAMDTAGIARVTINRPKSANAVDPALYGRGHELRPVIRADERRRAPQFEQIRQHIDHVGRAQLARNPDRKAFTGELVDDVQ